MNNDLKQSLLFDLQSLETELQSIESKIKEEESLNEKTGRAAKAGAATAGGLSTILVKQAIKSNPVGKVALLAHAIAGMKMGDEIADASIKAYNSNIVLLQKNRSNLIDKIDAIKEKLRAIDIKKNN